MKSRHTTIEFPVFSSYMVHVEVTSDLKKSMAKYPLTKVAVDDYGDGDGVAIHVDKEGFSFIFLRYNASVGDIAHESWHVVHRMMDFLGIELDHETAAYHLGYMVNKIFRFMRGRK